MGYIIDKTNGNCTVKLLADDNGFDVLGTEGHHVRMKTVAEFFGIKETAGTVTDWTYTGQVTVYFLSKWLIYLLFVNLCYENAVFLCRTVFR